MVREKATPAPTGAAIVDAVRGLCHAQGLRRLRRRLAKTAPAFPVQKGPVGESEWAPAEGAQPEDRPRRVPARLDARSRSTSAPHHRQPPDGHCDAFLAADSANYCEQLVRRSVSAHASAISMKAIQSPIGGANKAVVSAADDDYVVHHSRLPQRWNRSDNRNHRTGLPKCHPSNTPREYELTYRRINKHVRRNSADPCNKAAGRPQSC
jgi:hypothetical protein